MSYKEKNKRLIPMSKETCLKPTNGEYYAARWPGTPYAEDKPCRPLLSLRERHHRQAAPSPLDSVLQAFIGQAAKHRV